VDLGGLGDYEREGSSAMLYSGEALLLKLARVECRPLVLATVWECGSLVEEHVVGGVEG
jgi:hypothetical protein